MLDEGAPCFDIDQSIIDHVLDRMGLLLVFIIDVSNYLKRRQASHDVHVRGVGSLAYHGEEQPWYQGNRVARGVSCVKVRVETAPPQGGDKM